MRFFLSALLAVAAVVTAPAQAQRDNNCSGEGQRPCRRGPGCDDGLEVVDDVCVEVSDSGDGDDPPICGSLGDVPCPDGCDEDLEEVDGSCVEVSDVVEESDSVDSDGCGGEGEPICEPCDNDDLDPVGGICTDLTGDRPCTTDEDCVGTIPDRVNGRFTVAVCGFGPVGILPEPTDEPDGEIGMCVVASTAGGNIGK